MTAIKFLINFFSRRQSCSPGLPEKVFPDHGNSFIDQLNGNDASFLNLTSIDKKLDQKVTDKGEKSCYQLSVNAGFKEILCQPRKPHWFCSRKLQTKLRMLQKHRNSEVSLKNVEGG